MLRVLLSELYVILGLLSVLFLYSRICVRVVDYLYDTFKQLKKENKAFTFSVRRVYVVPEVKRLTESTSYWVRLKMKVFFQIFLSAWLLNLATFGLFLWSFSVLFVSDAAVKSYFDSFIFLYLLLSSILTAFVTARRLLRLTEDDDKESFEKQLAEALAEEPVFSRP